MLNKIIDWFITSSANPEEYSMTVQSLLMAGAGQVVSSLQNVGLNVSVAQYTNEVGHAMAVLGLVLAGVGFTRKVFLTVNTSVPTSTVKAGE